MKEISNNKGIVDEVLSKGRSSGTEKPVIICVVGRPGSGKSTFIRDKIGDEFIHLDAGSFFFKVGGEESSEFPGSVVDDLNEVGSRVAEMALEQRFDVVAEFTGSETVRMQMLMRALSDIGYEVEIKYVDVDLNQASIWNTERDEATISAQDTNDFHHRWLADGVNNWCARQSPAEEVNWLSAGTTSIRGLLSSIFSGSKSLNELAPSIDDAMAIIDKFRTFISGDDSASYYAAVIPDASVLPLEKERILQAFEKLLSSVELAEESNYLQDYNKVFDFQKIDSHDVKLIEELSKEPSDRAIAIQLTRDDLSEADEEELELVRMHRNRLLEKYQRRAESELSERAAAPQTSAAKFDVESDRKSNGKAGTNSVAKAAAKSGGKTGAASSRKSGGASPAKSAGKSRKKA